MLQTVLVYLSLTVIMLFLSNRRGRGQWFGVSLAVLLYAIVFGVRYGVGTDYFGYLYYYKLAQTSLSEFDSYEAGFNFLINLFAGEGAHFSVFFGAIAFLQLFLICFSLRKHKEIISYMFFVFMMACVWLSFSNGIRQELAFCFFIVAIFCLSTKRKWLYFFFVMFAYLMHKSAIILIAFYPLFIWKKEWFVDVKKQLIALCVAIVLMNFSLVGSVVGLLDNLIISLGYEEYMKDKYLEIFESEVTFGVGFYVILIINIILISQSKDVKRLYKETWMPYAYNLYYVGVLWRYVFISSMLLQRINYYMYGFDFIIGAFTLAYLKNRKRTLFFVLAALYLLLFAGYMSGARENHSMFYFFWQEQEYKQFISR